MPGDADMKLTKADLKKDGRGNYPIATAPASKGPKYPWGLEIRLDDISLTKLGMTDLPEVGELCQITGTGRIVSVSQRESEGSSSKDVTIQIERLGLEVKEESDAAEAAEADKAFEAGALKGRGKPRGY
jgi:hypothetical protein